MTGGTGADRAGPRPDGPARAAPVRDACVPYDAWANSRARRINSTETSGMG
jgi:hypothetical protein